LFFLLLISALSTQAQQRGDSLYSFTMDGDTRVTIDAPVFNGNKKLILICYALPNGNTTEQTMGKKIQPGDDWHYDIQHIRAQTEFIRAALYKEASVAVAYFENSYKSWPAWKTHHEDHAARIKRLVDTVYNLLPAKNKVIYLNGHSGGGRFIFSYLDAITRIPEYIERISFLDSNYGYDSTYMPKLNAWLQENHRHRLNVFAYNDSVALYQGKPVVSATGGTWYKSHRMMNDLSACGWQLRCLQNDSLQVYAARGNRVQFFLKTNPDRIIYHTVQVERNGFIHSVLCGTKHDARGYVYFGERAYVDLVK
jgi:hypothetical protein